MLESSSGVAFHMAFKLLTETLDMRLNDGCNDAIYKLLISN